MSLLPTHSSFSSTLRVLPPPPFPLLLPLIIPPPFSSLLLHSFCHLLSSLAASRHIPLLEFSCRHPVKHQNVNLNLKVRKCGIAAAASASAGHCWKSQPGASHPRLPRHLGRRPSLHSSGKQLVQVVWKLQTYEKTLQYLLRCTYCSVFLRCSGAAAAGPAAPAEFLHCIGYWKDYCDQRHISESRHTRCCRGGRSDFAAWWFLPRDTAEQVSTYNLGDDWSQPLPGHCSQSPVTSDPPHSQHRQDL